MERMVNRKMMEKREYDGKRKMDLSNAVREKKRKKMYRETDKGEKTVMMRKRAK